MVGKRRCTTCGTEAVDDARFCGECGAILAEAPVVDEAPTIMRPVDAIAESSASSPVPPRTPFTPQAPSAPVPPPAPTAVPHQAVGGDVEPPATTMPAAAWSDADDPGTRTSWMTALAAAAVLLAVAAIVLVVLLVHPWSDVETVSSTTITTAPSASSTTAVVPVTATLAGITDGRTVAEGERVAVSLSVDQPDRVRRTRLVVDGVPRDVKGGAATSLAWLAQGTGSHQLWAELDLDAGPSVTTTKVTVVVTAQPSTAPSPAPTATPGPTPAPSASPSAPPAVLTALDSVYTAFVANDWPTLRSRFRDLKGKVATMSDGELVANYGMIREYELVPASVRPAGEFTFSVRLGVVTHEDDGGRRYTRVMCIPMDVVTEPDYLVEQTGPAARFDTYDGWLPMSGYRSSLASC